MNERIKQLALQAGFEIEEANFSYGNYKVDNEYFFSREDFIEDELKKFAELIVLECMNICAEREEDIRTRIRDERQAATAYMCRAYIKEHFGVKE
jgi:hypothetical protein